MNIRVSGVLFLTAAMAACTESPVATTDDPAAAIQAQSLANAASSATDPLSKANRLPAPLEEMVHRLRADLESSGYATARGYWSLWEVEDCKATIQAVGFCYGNNPTAPYVVAFLPRWKDEHVDQELHHAFLKGQRNMSSIFRLDDREALVVLAELPPPARYLGMQTSVFTREESLNPTDPIYQSLPEGSPLRDILFATSPNPSRFLMIASLGNSTNNVVIQDRSQSVWNQQRFVVITPDQGMADEMTAALLRAGVPSADHVFTEPVSPEVARVGLHASADDFITYIRYARPEDEAAGEEWRERLPLTILRVRDMNPSRELDPFPIPSYDPSSANFDESVLSDDLDSLVAAVKSRWGQQEIPSFPYFSALQTIDLVGHHCLGLPGPLGVRGPMNCLGDGQDAEYQLGPTVSLDGDTVLAVIGTLGTETGNATYVSLSVNWFPKLVGLQNLSDDDLKGSAAAFHDALDHPDRLFYVHYLARDCTGLDYCLEVPRKLIPTGGTIKVVQRSYVNPGTARAPDPSMMLHPVAILLDGRQRPIR
jgi:hypothetical protein